MVVLVDPLAWGVGAVLRVEKDGRLLCEFDQSSEPMRELFDPFELEVQDVWMKGDNSLSARDLDRLLQGDTRKH